MGSLSDSTKHLFRHSNNQGVKELGEEEEEEVSEYIRDESNPIPIAMDKETGEYVFIDVNSTTVIGMFGPSGSGKTTGDMSIASRCYRRNRLPVNLADTDLHTTNLDNHGGVSKYLQEVMGLYPGESPLEIPQKTVMPKYMMNKLAERSKPSNVESFSLGFQDINQSELKFLLSQGLDKNQRQAMESVLNDASIDGDLSFKRLKGLVDENDEIHGTTGNKLKRNIQNLKDTEIITPRYRMDIVKEVQKGKAFGLGMRGFGRLSPDDYYLMEFLAKKCFDSLIDARMDGELSFPLMAIFPEAHHLMPRDADSILSDKVKRLFTFDQRRADIPAILDTQNPTQLEDSILQELNHVFIGCDKNGKSLAAGEWKKVLKLLNVVSNPQRDNKRWMSVIQDLDHRDFLYVTPRMSDPSDARVIRFLAPLTSNP